MVNPDSTELTPRQREVFSYVARGKRNKEIARALDISERTVEQHVIDVCLKFSCNNRFAAAVAAGMVTLT